MSLDHYRIFSSFDLIFGLFQYFIFHVLHSLICLINLLIYYVLCSTLGNKCSPLWFYVSELRYRILIIFTLTFFRVYTSIFLNGINTPNLIRKICFVDLMFVYNSRLILHLLKKKNVKARTLFQNVCTDPRYLTEKRFSM